MHATVPSDVIRAANPIKMAVAAVLPCLVLYMLICHLPPGLPQGRPSSGMY